MPPKKTKRGRQTKKEVADDDIDLDSMLDLDEMLEEKPKKRGRKPKNIPLKTESKKDTKEPKKNNTKEPKKNTKKNTNESESTVDENDEEKSSDAMSVKEDDIENENNNSSEKKEKVMKKATTEKPPPKRRGRKPRKIYTTSTRPIDPFKVEIDDEQILLKLPIQTTDILDETGSLLNLSEGEPVEVGDPLPSESTTMTALKDGLRFADIDRSKMSLEELEKRRQEEISAVSVDINNPINPVGSNTVPDEMMKDLPNEGAPGQSITMPIQEDPQYVDERGPVDVQTNIKECAREIHSTELLPEFKCGYTSTTNVHCWWCCHQFDTKPIGIPNHIQRIQKHGADDVTDFEGNYTDLERLIFYMYGCFCSFSCALAYLHNERNKSNQSRYLLNLLHHKLTGYRVQLKPAPPRQSLAIFGGYLTIEQFREKSTKISKNFKIVKIPMLSQTQAIEETTTQYGQIGTMSRGGTGGGKKYKLARTKPLKNHRGTIDAYLGT